jgi:hypothetical protein
MNRRLVNTALVSTLPVLVPSLALACGDMDVLFTFGALVLLICAFLIALTMWRTWRDRFILSLVFFIVVIAINFATANVPYTDNKVWLSAVLIAVPAAAWIGTAIILRRKHRVDAI